MCELCEQRVIRVGQDGLFRLQFVLSVRALVHFPDEVLKVLFFLLFPPELFHGVEFSVGLFPADLESGSFPHL